MSYELAGPVTFRRRVGGVRRPLAVRPHYLVDRRRLTPQQLEGLGFSLKPPKKVRKFIKKYGKRIAIGAALAIAAPFVLPAAAGAVFSASKMAWAAGSRFVPGLFKKLPTLPTLPTGGSSTPYSQTSTQDMSVPGDAPAAMSPSGGGGGGGAMTMPEPPEDDTTAPAPAPAAAGGAGLAIGALLVGGLLLANSKKRA